MDPVEVLLQDTLADRAGQAPTGPLPLVEPTERRDRLTAVALTTAVVVAVAVLAVALSGPAFHRPGAPANRGNHTSAGPGSTTTVVPAPVLAGLWLASYKSVSLHVPVGLSTRSALCGEPIANDVVALDGGNHLCKGLALASHPGTIVWFGPLGDVGPYSGIRAAATSFDGHAARRGYYTHQQNGPLRQTPGTSELVTIPHQNVAFGVTATTRAAADAIVRCQYSGTDPAVLIGSYPLDASRTGRLVAALDELRPDPCKCVHGGTPAPSHTEVIYFNAGSETNLRITGNIGATSTRIPMAPTPSRITAAQWWGCSTT